MPPSESFTPSDHRRVRAALWALAVCMGVLGLGQLANAALRGDTSTLIHAAFILSGSVLCAVTLARLRSGPLGRAVLLSASAMLLLTIPATKAQFAGPIVAVGPLLVFSLALPYVRNRSLMGLAVFTGLVTVINLVIYEFFPGPRVDSGPVPASGLYVLFATAGVGVTLYFLWLYSTRLGELRDGDRTKTQALLDTSTQLSGVVESSPQAIALFDPEGRVRLWNAASETLFGIPQGQAMGQRIDALLAGDERATAVLAQLRDGKPVSGVELGGGLPGQPRLQLEISAGPVFAGSDLTGYVVLATDVGKRKKLESDLLQAQKMESVGLLSSGIAHDLNNLLTIIMAESSLMLPAAKDARSQEGLAAIEEATERAADLCRRMLAFSRRQLVQPRPHDLRDIVTGLLPMLQRMVGPGISLRSVPSLTPAVVRIDKGQFEQVLLNLSVNARDAMPEGGELFFSIDVTANDVVVLVRDTGAGMPPDVQARAFEPFFTTKGAGHGTGLGLATVANVVRSAGGEVEVASKLGEGTLFRFRFPRELDAHAAALTLAAHETPPRGRNRKVLLVDDDERVRRVAEKALVARGYIVVTADSAVAALARLELDSDIEVLVTDVIMPGVNGRVLAEQAAELRAGLPVLFISGYSSDERLAQLVESGRAHFLAKPFTSLELEAAVDRALSQPPSSSEPPPQH